MNTISLEGQRRQDAGKKATKLLRKADMVPCVMYGGSENVSFKVKYNDLLKIVFTNEFLKVNVTVDGKAKDVTLTKTGSRWLPEDMVKEWPDMMAEANKGLAELGDMKPEQKQGMLMMLKMVQTSITDLETAKDKDELMKKIQGLASMFGGH